MKKKNKTIKLINDAISGSLVKDAFKKAVLDKMVQPLRNKQVYVYLGNKRK